MAGSFLDKLFKTEEKNLKRIKAKALEVDALKDKIASLSDSELKYKTVEFKQALDNGKTLEDILVEAFAVAREAAKRTIKQFPYIEQIEGAIVLHEGDVAEMKTGEGKTLTSTMAVYLNALSGKGVHVITVNDYLAKRDADWMGNIYRFLGLSVGVNYRELTPQEKQAAYACDVTYTTNAELGFDYLRDNMLQTMKDRVLRPHLNMALVDECDSILIDESRTPLIISGGQKQAPTNYKSADIFVKTLTKEEDFVIDLESKSVSLTEAGNKKAEKAFGVDNLYKLEYSGLVHNIHQALKANYTMQNEVDYLVKDDEIVIVDSFTGRLLQGRTFSDGLHQALEAKEGVTIKPETSVLATITYQNFFRLYDKLSGMTGTAKTEEEEFFETYNMRVIEIPTHVKVIREDAPDLVYQNKEYKYKALVEEVKQRHATGQPILIGTIAVETSEVVSKLLKDAGIPHEVLNAKNHAREAEIIKNAGQKNAVTIATNMAGRGTDIKLGEGVNELGGLAVIGTERHESRRIDNQLRGRSGRQGDPGYSRFYVSLEDDLMARFGNDTLTTMFKSLEDQAIESPMVTRVITSAQTRVEGYNYDIRKTLLGYDDVLRQQREIMYKQRDDVIANEDDHKVVLDLFRKVAEDVTNKALYYEAKEPMVDQKKLHEMLTKVIVPSSVFSPEDLKGLNPNQTVDAVVDIMAGFFERNKVFWGEKVFRAVEKQILLRIIDMNWTAHIDRMAKLREGINLRAYAQTNPLQSYINEGYQMFQDMVIKIAKEATFYCLHATVKFSKKPATNEA